MLDASGVKELAAQTARPRVEKVNGIERAFLPMGDGKWEEHKLATPSVPPKPLQFTSLSGLSAYLLEGPDDLLNHDGPLALHVVDYRTVDLIGHCEIDDFSQRYVYARAVAEVTSFPFSQFFAQEYLQIALQTEFVGSTVREELMSFIASVKSGATREIVDDRVAQTVTARRGISMSENKAVPNPWSLAPYRTFPEIHQPESLFVFRARGGSDSEPPELGLFEADGRAWKLEAMARIAAKLSELSGGKVPVLA